MLSGFVVLLLVPDVSKVIAYWIDWSLASLVDLFWYRVETFEW